LVFFYKKIKIKYMSGRFFITSGFLFSFYLFLLRIAFFPVLLFLGLQTHSFAQKATTSKGKEFWAGFMLNRDSGRELALYISSEVATQGTVSIPGQGFSQNFTIGAGENIKIPIPVNSAMAFGCNPDIENKGVLITAEDSIYVFALNRAAPSTDAALILPIHALGVDYYVMTEGIARENNQSWGIAGHQCIILATQDNAAIEVTPSAATCGGWQAGQSYTITLNRGEIFRLRAINGDLTGTRVRTIGCQAKPFAVFAGHVWTNLGGTGASDHLFEQMIPISFWGKSYIASPTLGRTIGDIGKVLAAANNTRVKIGDNREITLNCGQSYTFDIPSGDFALAIQADKPILVGHFNKGEASDLQTDPFFILLSPIEKMPLRAITAAAMSIAGDWRHAVNIIAQKEDTSFINCDAGALRWFPTTGNPNYYHARLWVPEGNIRISSLRGGFLATLCGHKNIESYGYGAGLSLIPNAFRIEAPSEVCQDQTAFFRSFSDFPSAETHWEPQPGVVLYGAQMEYAFPQAGTFTVTAKMRSPLDFCPATTEFCLQHRLTVLPAPQLEYSQPTPLCQGWRLELPLTLVNAPVGNRAKLYYTLGQAPQDSLFFETDGKATLLTPPLEATTEIRWLELINITSGCSTALNQTVPITVLPLAQLPLWDLPQKICQEDPLLLKAQEAIPGLAYTWEILRELNAPAIASFPELEPPAYVFPDAGTYFVRLRALQPGCNEVKEERPIRVLGKSVLSWRSIPKLLCFNRLETLSLDLPESSVELAWRCQGGELIPINPKGNFLLLPKEEKIEIEIWQANSFCPPERLVTTLNVTPKLTLRIAAAPQLLCPKEPFTFRLEQSSAPLDSVLWFCQGALPQNRWKGEGPFDAYFIAPGSYALKAVGFLNTCLSDTVSVGLRVKAPPTAEFEITPIVICLGSKALATYKGPIGADYQYRWQCENCKNNPDNFPQVSLEFTSSGVKTVALQVEANGCSTAFFTQTLEVRKPAPAELEELPPSCSLSTRFRVANARPGYRYALSPEKGKWLNRNFSSSPQEEITFSWSFQEIGALELLLAITDTMGCQDTLPIKYTYNPAERFSVSIPNVFTPNGDGVNDFWSPEGPAKDCLLKLQIFDRFGKLVFSANGARGAWDGNIEGEPAQEGVYLYVLELQGVEQTYAKTGMITLLR
jgi:gliding motility-associated-like protein